MIMKYICVRNLLFQCRIMYKLLQVRLVILITNLYMYIYLCFFVF